MNRFFQAVDTHPQIAEVRKEPHQKSNIGSAWHTDHSYDQIPALGSILYAREVPEVGGDTLFSSMYAAYESLSDGLQETLKNMRAEHSSRHVFGEAAYAEEDPDDRGEIYRLFLAIDGIHVPGFEQFRQDDFPIDDTTSIGPMLILFE